jgi:hypothetical protein
MAKLLCPIFEVKVVEAVNGKQVLKQLVILSEDVGKTG